MLTFENLRCQNFSKVDMNGTKLSEYPFSGGKLLCTSRYSPNPSPHTPPYTSNPAPHPCPYSLHPPSYPLHPPPRA